MLSILYVDDNPMLQDLTRRFLERNEGIRVDVADTVFLGLQMVTEANYDAIVSDYEMPCRDGISFLKEIRSSGNSIPFILFTGRSREDVAIAALNNGADFYLQKGTDSCQYVELMHMIRTAVDRYRSRDEISRSRQMMKDMINHLPDPTFAVDLNGRIIAWNEAMKELSGIPAEEMIGKDNYAYSLPFYGERRPLMLDYLLNASGDVAAYYKKPVRTERGYTGSTTCLLNGVLRTFWVKATQFSDADGNLTGAIESIRDTTQRVRLLHTLQNARNHFENIIEHLPDPTFAIDRRGVVIAWNMAMENFTGVARETILGIGDRAYALAVYNDKRDTLLDSLLQSTGVDADRYDSIVTSSNSISACVRVLNRSENSERIIWAVAGVLSDQSGYSYGAIETLRDITHIRSIEEELQKKQEALSSAYEELEMSQEELNESYQNLTEWQHLLEASELKYRTLVENSNDGVFLVQDSRYVYVNPSCAAISGYLEGDLYEMNIWETIAPDDQPAFVSYVTDIMNGFTNRERYIGRIHTRAGEIKTVEFAFGLVEYSGRPALLGRGRDITDRIRAERALFQANRKLHLLSSITRHDIKNHLTSLQASLTMLCEEAPAIENTRLLHLAVRSGEAIDQAISFTALYQDIGITQPGWADIACEFSAHSAMARAHGISLQIDLTEQLEILVDPLFSRVCFNLIENTVRHGGTVSTIRISAEKNGNSLIVLVADDGDGIPAAEKDQIFLQGHGKNSGMGLFLSREILMISEIELREIGIEGNGAVFELTIPYEGYRCRPFVSNSKIPSPSR